jgi:integrase
MALRFSRLTRDAIRRLKPGERLTEHGISADRLANGDTRYTVSIMVDGQRIHRVIGRESENTTRSQAENFIGRVRNEAKEKRLNLPKGRKTPLTFERAANVYLDGQKEIGAKDIESKERHLTAHLIPFFGNMRIDGISEDAISEFTVEKFRNHCRRKEMAEGGVNRILATYRHMGNQLARRKIVPAPFPMVRLQEGDSRRDNVLSTDQEKCLLAAALEDSNTRTWLFIKMGLSTAMRHSEILSVRLDALDIQRRRLRVLVKGGRWRDQPLSQEMVDILSSEREMAEEGEEWFFPNPKSGHVESMKKAFRRTVGRAGLDPSKVIPHTMRHTAITNLIETGAHARTVQQVSGHKSLDMVMRYTHARQERVDEALEKMERAKIEPVQIGPRKVEDS